jgi:hypothetical protein
LGGATLQRCDKAFLSVRALAPEVSVKTVVRLEKRGKNITKGMVVEIAWLRKSLSKATTPDETEPTGSAK